MCCAPARSSKRRYSPSTPEKRQIKLSMKQLIPTSIDEYIAEHKVGDTVSGRVVDDSGAVDPSNSAKASAPRAA